MNYDPAVIYVLRHKDGKRYLSENSDGVLSWRGWGGSTLTSVPQCFGQVPSTKQSDGEWLPHDDEEKGKPIPRDFWCQAAKGR